MRKSCINERVKDFVGNCRRNSVALHKLIYFFDQPNYRQEQHFGFYKKVLRAIMVGIDSPDCQIYPRQKEKIKQIYYQVFPNSSLTLGAVFQ